jgi:D-xylose transport system substrate-binding protein
MILRRMAAITAAAAVVLVACTSTGSGSPGASGAAASGGGAGCVVGVSWNDYDQERWKKADEPAITDAVEAAGGSYIKTDARDSSEQQITDIDSLINQGAGALIILAKDADAIKPAVTKALDEGIPVIAYDRLIEDSGTFYITFDNKKVGFIIAETIMGLVPEGNYAIIKGDAGDANAQFLRDGFTEAGIPELGDDSGAIKVVFEQNTPSWDTEGAKNNMEAALNSTTPVNDIQAVLSENDGMATGAIQALEAVGVDAAVGGQDGDAAALNRVALGTQAVSVWKNAFALGQTAGDIAMQLCGGTDLKDAKAPADLPEGAAPDSVDAVDFTTPGGNTVSSITLAPTPITQDNLNEVIDSGWVTKDVVCAGVTAGSVAACP